jgi:hypothetical protein
MEVSTTQLLNSQNPYIYCPTTPDLYSVFSIPNSPYPDNTAPTIHSKPITIYTEYLLFSVNILQLAYLTPDEITPEIAA